MPTPNLEQRTVPSPSLWELTRQFPRLRGNRIAMLDYCFRQHGSFFKLELPGAEPTYFISDPADIKHVLVSNQNNYHKTGAYQIGRELFGQGLLSSEDQLHHRQRRTLQPMFLQRKLDTFGELMGDETEKLLARWEDGAPLDIAQEMLRLTVSIVGQAMFGVDLAPHSRQINQAFTTAQRHVAFLDSVWFPIPKILIAGRIRRYREAIGRLNKIVSDIIESGRTRANGEEDALSLLSRAKTEDGEPIGETQIRDEVQTLMLAGHETTANVLSWTWYRLSQQPEVEAGLQAELREVLGGRAATPADIPALIYTNMVFSEALRLYPPVWILGRRALATDRLPSGAEIPANVSVASMPYLAHRNPRYFPDPECFDPERFNPANQQQQQRPAFAYFPFGGGARSCIGEGFARMESVLILATIAQRYRLVPEPGQSFKAEPLLTYRLRRGNQMRIHRRAQSATAPSPVRAPAAEHASAAAACGRSILVNDQSHHCPGRSQSSV